MRLVLYILLLALFLPSSALYAQENAVSTNNSAGNSFDLTTTIPFSRAGNLILIRAKVDSTEGNFILDTGAPGLVLNITYFREYATSEHTTDRGGVAGEIAPVPQTILKEFSFGGLHFRKQEADLVNLGHIEDVKKIKVSGLIGVSFFLGKELIIDYQTNQLHVRGVKKNSPRNKMLSDTSSYSVVPINVVEHKIVAYTKLAGRKMKFIIDTGAESNVLDSRLPNKVFELVSINRRTQVLGINNKKMDALMGSLKGMQVGNKEISALPVVITNLENACISTMCCVDGMLGFDFLSLHKIGFNFATEEMYIWK